MPSWHEVFDNQDALLRSRQRVRGLTRWYGLAALGVALGAPLAIIHLPGGTWLAAGAALVLIVAGVWLTLVLRQLYAVAWCVRISFHELVADFGRRRTAFRWEELQRVELDDEGIILVGPDTGGAVRRLRLPDSFPEYTRLSHRVVEYAEAHRRPVYLDGQPWQLLDVDALYPFLREALREAS